MANEKLSQLPAGAPPLSTDLVYIARGGAQYYLTVGQLITPIAGTVPFSGITAGSNTTAALTVGTGGSLGPAGTGVINATEVLGLKIQAGVATSGGSTATVTFSPAFTTLVAIVGVGAAGTCNLASSSVSGAVFNATVSVNWIAIGT